MSSSEKNEPTLKVGSSEAPPLSVPPLLPFKLLTLFGFKLQGTDPMTQNQGDYVTIRGIQVKKRRMISKTGTSLHNGVSMTFEMGLGFYQSLINQNVFFIGEDDLVYICGKHLVRYNILRKKQNFTIKSLEDEKITAMNFFYKNKTSSKIAVALQSRSNILPMVKIYDPLKNITSNLVHSHLDIEVNITGVVIVFRGRYLLTLAEREKGSLYTISAWTCDLEEFVTSVDVTQEITQIDVSLNSPSKDKAIFSLVGPKYIGIWDFDKIEKEIKPVKEDLYAETAAIAPISCHCWLKDEGGLLLVACGMDLFFFGEEHTLKEKMTYAIPNDVFVKSELEKNPEEHEAILRNSKILSLCPRKRGFVIGLGGIPVVAVYMPKAITGFQLGGSYRIKNSPIQSIASISSSLDDMYLALTVTMPYTHSQIQTSKETEDFSMTGLRGEDRANSSLDGNGNIEILAFNFSAVEVSRHQMKDPFENIFEKGVHYQQINGLALCPTKPYLTTVSEDSSLKIWDLNSDDRQKFSYMFHQPPLCIDIHPLSIQIAVGFKDGFRLYFLLEDDIKLAFEYYGKTCTAAKYAESGHLIAVGLSHFVSIYDTYSMKQIRTMTGHNGLLMNFNWISNDRYLLSYCAAGIVRVWNEDGWVQHFEFILGTNKSTRFYSVAYDDEFDYLVLCCSDGKLRIVEEKASNDLMEYDIAPAYFTCVHINKKMKIMFLGTNLGSVRIYLWPILEMKKEQIECVEVAVHQGPIHHIETTFDFSYLVTTSQDGSIYVSKLREFIDGEDISNMDLFNVLSKGKEIEDLGKISNTYNFSPFCLVSNASQQDKIKQIRKMEEKLLDLQSELEEEKEKMCNYYNEYISEKEKENRETLLTHKEKLAVIMEEKDTDLKTLVHNIDNSKQTFEKSLEEMELNYHQKLLDLYKENNELNSELDAYKGKMLEDTESIQKESEKVLQDITVEYQRKYEELYDKYKVAVFNLKIDQKKFEEALMQTEAEYDIDLKNMKEKYEKELQQHKQFAEKTRTQNGKLKKENEKHKERDQNLNNLIAETRNQNDQLSLEIRAHNDKMKEMDDQLRIREKLINEKEANIKDLRTKNQHLQNFKSVYDHRVTTLKDESVPLNDYFENLDHHISSLYKELLSEAEANKKLMNYSDQLDELIKELKKDLVDRDSLLLKSKRQIECFEYKALQIVANRGADGAQTSGHSSGSVVKNQLEELLSDSELFLTKVEGVLARANNVFVTSMIENREAQNLEKLSTLEMNAIKDELIRLRDFLSKKLQTTTIVNGRMERERDFVYKKIQNDGKLLIKKCNELRTDKMDIKYKLGTYQKQAKELTREVSLSFAKLAEHQQMNGITFNQNASNSNSIAQAPKPKSGVPMGPASSSLPSVRAPPSEISTSQPNFKKSTFDVSVPVESKKSDKIQSEISQKDMLSSMLREADKYYGKNKAGLPSSQHELESFHDKLKSLLFLKNGPRSIISEDDESTMVNVLATPAEMQRKKLQKKIAESKSGKLKPIAKKKL